MEIVEQSFAAVSELMVNRLKMFNNKLLIVSFVILLLMQVRMRCRVFRVRFVLFVSILFCRCPLSV